MLSASLYIIVCSARNRVRVRLRRLREPRYVVGAIAGAAYFYFTIFARMWGRGTMPSRRRGRPTSADAALQAFRAAGPALVGVGLLVLMALAWVFPGDSGLLEFTDAEVQFLFTAPVSRRSLLMHRLMRSQIGVLFAAIVPALVFPTGSTMGRVRFAAAMWVLLVTIRVHFTGITLARASLALGGVDARRRQWGPLAAMLAAVAYVVATLVKAFRGMQPADMRDALDRFSGAVSGGAARVILWPFMALARPLFADATAAYFTALALSVLVLAANVVWVLRSDEALQEATAQAEARRAARKARERPVARVRAAAWTLAPSGRQEMIFVWKGAMQMLRETNIVVLLRYGAPLLALAIGLTSVYTRSVQMRGVAAVAGGLAAGLAVIVVLMGPQIARTDLRQDLLHLELLKTWPIRSSALIRGEMLWPAALLTAVAWGAILCAMILWSPGFAAPTLAWRISIALAAAIIAPAFVFAQFTIHNAAAVLFPAWVPLGTSRPRGVDAMGQRLIMFAGILIGLVAMIAPGAIAGALIWFAFQRFGGAFVLLPAAAACAAIVLIEVLVVTEALGPAYDRLDLSAVERAE